jgi:hypothetical protein
MLPEPTPGYPPQLPLATQPAITVAPQPYPLEAAEIESPEVEHEPLKVVSTAAQGGTVYNDHLQALGAEVTAVLQSGTAEQCDAMIRRVQASDPAEGTPESLFQPMIALLKARAAQLRASEASAPALAKVQAQQAAQAQAETVMTMPGGGVVPSMSPAERQKYNDLLRALQNPSAQDIMDATTFAAVLKSKGLATESNALRSATEAAAKKLSVPVSAATAALPNTLRQAVERALKLEGDPTKIRQLIGQLAIYKNIEGVSDLIALLEQKAIKLDTVADKIATADAIDKIQKGEVVTTTSAQSVLPANLQAALDGALNGLGVKNDKVMGTANQAGINLAKQASELLKANGYLTESKKLDALIAQAQQMLNNQVVKPATSTSGYQYVVKSGDNPSSLAKTYANDGNRWKELVRANPQKKVVDAAYAKEKKLPVSSIGNFRTLYAGERLNWPAGWKTPETLASAPVVSPGITKGAPKLELPAQVPTTPATMTTYKVLSGDNPSTITKKLLGDEQVYRWKELIRANPEKKTDPKTGNFKTLYAGEVLKLPSDWKVPMVSGVGCIGCGLIGTEESKALDAASPDGVFLNVRFETRGRRMMAHGYLGAGTTTELFTVDVDMAPIAVAVAKIHSKLHGQVGCIGCDSELSEYVSGCIAGDCTGEIGKLRLGRAFKKASRAVKKIAKAKVLKKLGRLAKKALNNPITKGIVHAAAVAFPAVGMPALAAYKAANLALDAVEKAKKKAAMAKRAVKRLGISGDAEVSGIGRKLKRLAQRAKRKARGLLLQKAISKGMALTRDVQRKVEQAATGMAKRSVTRALKKAPHLTRKLEAARQLSNVSGVRSRILQKAPIIQKLERLDHAAQSGDIRAKKALAIMRLVKAQRDRQRLRGMNSPRGTIGTMGV